MNAKMWLMVLATATACGSTAKAGDATDVGDTTVPTGDTADVGEAGCKEGSSDYTFGCFCPGKRIPDFPVCTNGTFVCPKCPGPDGSTQDIPDSADAAVEPDVQANTNDDTIADTAPDVATAPYSAVQAVFDARCITCHSATALGLPGYAALPLTSDVSFKNLVNQTAHETCGNLLVTPGKPNESYLWQKLTAATPCEGGHMPAKFEVLPAPPLTTEQLAAIQDWIAGGALP